MVEWHRNRKVAHAVMLGVAALSLTGAACSSRAQNRATTPDVATQALARAPVVTPMTTRPRLLNQREVEKTVAKVYPPFMQRAGIGGVTKVWFFIDVNGRSVKQTIFKSSGNAELDAAALKVAPVLRFSPAKNGNKAVPVWVAIDIVFQVVRR